MEQHILKHNSASLHFNPVTDLPEGFLAFLLPLHRAFTPRQQELIKQRARVLAASHMGAVAQVIAGGASSLTALGGSTEEKQFVEEAGAFA